MAPSTADLQSVDDVDHLGPADVLANFRASIRNVWSSDSAANDERGML